MSSEIPQGNVSLIIALLFDSPFLRNSAIGNSTWNSNILIIFYSSAMMQNNQRIIQIIQCVDFMKNI